MSPLERSLSVLASLPHAAPRLLASFSPRPIVFLVAMAALVALRRGESVDLAAPSRSTALAEVLRTRGLECEPEDIVWVNGPNGVRGAMEGGARALVRASHVDEPADLYLVQARLSPEGTLLDVGSAYDVTRTTGADEGRPLLAGTIAAYTASGDGIVTAVHTIDLRGRTAAELEGFTRLQRWQTAITNLQQTGQFRGVAHDAFPLDPNAKSVDLRFRDDGMLAVRADGRAILIDVARGVTVEGTGWVREEPEVVARPGGLVPWAVDRVRAVPEIGTNGMQWIKMIAFTALEGVMRLKSKLAPDTSARDIAADMGSEPTPSGTTASFADPTTGWPPLPMTPLLKPALPGEGKWIPLDGDPFFAHAPAVPCPFVTSFIRTDRERRDTRIYVTLWDPRQIALHMMAGTVEPVSATGEAGPGRIPRVPEVMRHVVAGFNGGFQAMHGEYGMQVDDIEYLPPKPFAASVLEMRDGSTAFGAWPKSAEVPDEVLSFRQNLTAIVQNDRFNPWGRVWWGGTPPGWPDNIHTTRSAICLTKENFVGYFFGSEISAEVLAQALLQARCAFGVHLDMNPGLVGFELYDVEPAGGFAPLGRPLQPDWEWEGAVSRMPELRVRARRMVRSMVEVNFPQYIQLEARDFFYLTQRAVLPGQPLPAPEPREPGEGEWRVKGLPQHGFPYAVATTWVRLDPARPALRARVLRVDPHAVVPAGSPGTNEETPTVAAFFAPAYVPRTGQSAVWYAYGVFLTGDAPPTPGATPLAVGVPLSSPLASVARVAVGVHDEDGMLEWVELAPDVHLDVGVAHALDALLSRDGCRTRLFLPFESTARLGGLGGSLDLEGSPAAVPAGPSTRLVRGVAPAAHPIFEATPLVGPAVWQPLQMQRIRYFPKPRKAAPKPMEATSGSASASPSAAPAPPASSARLH
jgi:hypothetical protein